MAGMAGKSYNAKNKNRLESIPIGSGNIYMILYDSETPTVPTDEEFETDDNMVGRTEGGATLNYSGEFYTAKSDDGVAKKRRLTNEEASLSWGIMTWTLKTVEQFIRTARFSTVNEGDGKVDVVKVGGIANQSSKKYWIHFVGGDDIDGKLTITALGENIEALQQAFSDNNETLLSPNFNFDPHDSDGTLYIMKSPHFEQGKFERKEST